MALESNGVQYFTHPNDANISVYPPTGKPTSKGNVYVEIKVTDEAPTSGPVELPLILVHEWKRVKFHKFKTGECSALITLVDDEERNWVEDLEKRLKWAIDRDWKIMRIKDPEVTLKSGIADPKSVKYSQKSWNITVSDKCIFQNESKVVFKDGLPEKNVECRMAIEIPQGFYDTNTHVFKYIAIVRKVVVTGEGAVVVSEPPAPLGIENMDI